MRDSVRAKLTLWYVGALALTLTAFSLGVYALLSRTLHGRLDAGLRASIEAAAVSLAHEIAEGETPAQAANSTVKDLFLPHQALAVYDAEGRLLAERPARDRAQVRLPELSRVPSDQLLLFGLPATETFSEEVRAATKRVTVAPAGPSFIVAVGESFTNVNAELTALRRVFAVAVPLALVLAGLGGWLLARQSMAPVAAMSEGAGRIGAKILGERLPVVNPRDELGRLASAFNNLLERLDAAFAQQRQFMADASHELRTPLHVIRTASAVTLEKAGRAEAEYREALTVIDEQAARLAHIVEDLFTLARADAGNRPVERRDFYLDELIAEVSRAAAVLAARKEVSVHLAPATETPFRGDEGLLRQMLLNLLDNAIRHTPTGGRVSLRLARADGAHLIRVADTGAGIPEEAQAHVFERFYRADKARSRANGHGGAGLGLSIARWVVEAHGGTIRLEHSDSHGTTFLVALPGERA